MGVWVRRFATANLCIGILGLAIAMALGGCGGDNSSPPVPTATPIQPTPTPTPVPSPSPTPTPAGSISGGVMGGMGRIVGSQVTLYQAGQTASRTDAVVLGSATAD